VARILQELITQGFAHEDIALVSFHGQGKSVFSSLEQVGGVRLRRATGEYDDNNNQVLTPGKLTFETLYRFKGQEAPAVILVDVDPPPGEPERLLRWQRLMYCGVTRGTVRVEVVTLAGP
jgi:superfamily I DNA and RNA helicase